MSMKKAKSLLLQIVTLIVVAVGVWLYPELEGYINPPPAPTVPAEGTAEVHFVDVGQGSAILIKGSEKNVLIDTGEPQYADTLVQYLQSNGVNDLDYLINTHPHYDHMGGMLDVMEAIPTQNVIMTKLKESIIPTTKSYGELLDYLLENKETISTAEVELGQTIDMGNGLILTFIGPVEEFGDLNNASIVTKMQFGETSFLFMGDIENEAQQAMLETTSITEVTVIESAHHGSSTSIDADFMAGLSPEIAVIQCGADNDYGHPHQETLQLYDELGTQYYRNDTQGNIKIVTDGNTVSVTTQNK